MKKTLILCSIITMLAITPVAKAYDKDITIPTEKIVVIDGKIKSQIDIEKEVTSVNPWLYVDVKLDATKSKQSKYNYAELALKRSIGFFEDSRLSLKDGDFYIILNNDFIINKKNYKDKKVTDMAKKELLNKDFYRGDTLFKLAFLYHDNKVQRTTSWKLIDTIDLPAGSSHTLTKKYTVGINKNEELTMGQTLGIKLIAEVGGSSGIDCKFASAKILGKLNSDLNSTVAKVFKKNREIKSSFESSTNIVYNPKYGDKIVLRYQLVDNYKVEEATFKNATEKLEELMNQGGINIIKITPTSGEMGINVPTEQIFDISIDKNRY